MRTVQLLNSGWSFTDMDGNKAQVNIPHTWNALDGQDGGNDYRRGKCIYEKRFAAPSFDPEKCRVYLEFDGANASAEVVLNGKTVATHHGGYATFRCDITDVLQGENLLRVEVDNSVNDRVYPQKADFTFYGGIYRDVKLLIVHKTHFDLDYYGGNGLKITAQTNGSVQVRSWHTGENAQVRITLLDAEEKEVATGYGEDVMLTIQNPHLWHGTVDPYLYTCKAELLVDGNVVDYVNQKLGIRSIRADSKKGFFLNGKAYPLRGVCRHQDWKGIGNALSKTHHETDMALIREIGANTIRLAHYQHAQYFYDLCDEKGLVIWAEIPYISKHMPDGRANTISQMKELITQNYNHPSIVVWGLSNEITMKGADDPDLLENHRILNDLCHEMDKTRLTTIAAVSMCKMDDPYLQIPDVVSYNHYFGWYGGEVSMNGPWFDKFHATHPNIPIGCSEYGCEALNWHTSDPMQGDYTEEYQSYYHEELIKQLFTRKYMWATHVWNMFDFGADARSEGGENGQNHKGLVTMDRKYKKDSFYAYKAWLSDDPFVHLCSKRYIDRVEDVTKVTVYSNQPEVELFANGVSLGKKTAEDHFFKFDVPNVGETKLEAVAGDLRDEAVIRKVDTFNEEYRLKEEGAVLNWFDITTREGYLCLNDKMSEVLKTFRGKLLFAKLAKKLLGGGKKDGKVKAAGFEIKPDSGMMQMMGGFTVLRLFTMMGGMANVNFTKEELLKMNAQLNKIRKPR